MFKFDQLPGMGDKKARIAAAGVCAAVVVAIGAGVGLAASGNGDGTGASEATATADNATADNATAQALNAPQEVTINVTADEGWTSTATPAIVHITGRTATGDAEKDEDIDFYHAVNPSADNAGTDDIELSPGVYTAETISPLNADGSAYTVWKTGDAKHFAVGFDDADESATQAASAVVVNPFVTVAYAAETDGGVHYHAYADCNDCHGHFDLYNEDFTEHVRDTGHIGYVRHRYACNETDCTYTKLEKQGNRFVVQMEKVPADQVTDEMVKDIVDKTTEAVKGGDSSLKGDAGKDVLDKLDTNVKNNANASEETKSSAETAKETTDTSGEGKQTTGSNAAGNASKTDTSGNSTGAHVHDWAAQTSTVHHDAVTHVVHHDAVTHVVHHDAVTHQENVTETVKYYVCNDCGFRVTSEEFHSDGPGTAVADDFTEHMRDTGHIGYHTVRENVVTGTNTVVDQAAWDETVVDSAAWDETVVDSAAWDETVTNGYKCSTCGATK